MFILEKFPNKLDEIKLSFQAIEGQIATFSLDFPQIRRSDVEWGMKFPFFVPPFYKFLLTNEKIPKQEEYCNYYFSENSSWFHSNGLSDDQLEGLKARLYRTYPSLVRDVHFGIFIKESKLFEPVLYNESLDIEHGIDFIIGDNGKLFAVNLFTETRIGRLGRKKKAFRHKKINGLIYIELPVAFQGSKKCGQFFLYREREINNLREVVKKHA